MNKIKVLICSKVDFEVIFYISASEGEIIISDSGRKYFLAKSKPNRVGIAITQSSQNCQSGHIICSLN
jgi:hypothetical protein